MKSRNLIKRFLYSQKIAPFIFITPFILVFSIFFAYPLISAVFNSFHKVQGGSYIFAGMSNYKNLLNPIFYKSIIHSLIYTMATCVIMIPMPLLLAYLLNSKYMPLKSAFRGAMFIPALTSVVVAGTVFRMMFGELSGALVNQFIGFWGRAPISWLRKESTMWIVIILLSMWRWTGVNMMYYLAGLQQIPEDLYEASSIDGANWFQQFTRITLPMVKPTIIYILTISLYGGLAMFTESYMLFNGNNSPNNIGLTIVGFLYRMGWEKGNIGLASATGCVLLVIASFINIIQLLANGTIGKENR